MEEEISKFRQVIGDSATSRILEYVVETEDLDFTLTDIAEGAEVSWSTLHRIWPNLEKAGIVVQTRTVGNAKLFTLNKESQIAKALVSLFNQTVFAEQKLIA